jgi:hypothetical protein
LRKERADRLREVRDHPRDILIRAAPNLICYDAGDDADQKADQDLV